MEERKQNLEDVEKLKKEIEELKKNIEELKKKLEETEKLKEEYLKGWQRERADFLNYRMEEEKRFEEFFERKKEKLILEFLPILDNFEIAKKNVGNEKDPKIEGFLQIEKQILEFFKKLGLEEIKTEKEKLNLLEHEVVEEIETDEFETGTVIEEVQKGYKLNGKVIRPAKVKIAK
jgi:molecular chaperone GrpE